MHTRAYYNIVYRSFACAEQHHQIAHTTGGRENNKKRPQKGMDRINGQKKNKTATSLQRARIAKIFFFALRSARRLLLLHSQPRLQSDAWRGSHPRCYFPSFSWLLQVDEIVALADKSVRATYVEQFNTMPTRSMWYCSGCKQHCFQHAFFLYTYRL